MNKEKLICWENTKWFIKELIKTMSDKPSYFSKKRIQAWILFDSGLLSMMTWFCYHFKMMDNLEIIAFSSVLFGAAGYQVSTIQREKRDAIKLKNGESK